MQEKLITFETAKLAKEKGLDFTIFPWNYSCYELKTGKRKNKDSINKELQIGDGHLPTQSLLQKWLREIHKIEVFVKKGYGYEWYIEDTNLGDGTYNTFEKALEAGLQEALKLVE